MANMKLDVDISSFNANINTAKNILKGLDAEMKATDATFKATGNSEQQLTQKTKTLNSQINMQKSIAQQAQQALKAMTDAGVDPADAAYQRMYATMMNATAGMNNAQAELNSLGASAQNAAAGADQLSSSVQSIGKKMSLEQVQRGIESITSGLEKAAKKAIQLGEELWNSVMNSARWADDTATMAQMYGITVTEYQQMQGLVASGLDTSVEAMLDAQDKLKKGIGKGSKETIGYLEELGISVRQLSGDEGVGGFITRDTTELFWETGQAIMQMTDASKQEAAAQTLLGRSWKELKPLFETYKTADEYRAALESVATVSEESVQAGADLNDKISELTYNFDTLKNEVLLSLAPALTDAANALNDLLKSVLEYLKRPEGQEMLQKLGDAVSGLFDDLKKIDPESVVENFTSIFTGLTSGIQWLSDNWESVVAALKGILLGWAGLELTGGALKVLELVQGITGLTSSAASAAGTAAGSSWGAAFGAAAMKASPYLLFLYEVLHPAGSATDDQDVLFDANGNPTTAGREAGLTMTQEQYEKEWEYRNENQARADEIRKRNEELVMEKLNLAKINEEEMKRNEIIQNRAMTIPESKDTSNPTVINAGGALDFILYPIAGLVNLFTGPGGGKDDRVEVPAELDLPTDQAAGLAEQVGTVTVPATLSFAGMGGGGGGMVGVLDKWFNIPQFANGTNYVPYDGMLARLHKGERVIPAREAARNYSSNLYVESMYMNNGMDAQGLAAAMAAAQRRTASGYGS